MAAILTPDDVVGRIAAECTFIDERGVLGIRLERAALSSRACSLCGCSSFARVSRFPLDLVERKLALIVRVGR
jgi:hypothetical protein